MLRIPLLSDSRVVVVGVPDDAEVLRPPPPGETIADVGAAVRDALRFPLSGGPLEALVPRGGRVTVVIEPASLPPAGALRDPRREALAAALDELERAGVPSERQTILVAGGLARRVGQRELELLLAPALARRYRGAVVVHDAEDPELVELGELDGLPLRVNRALLDADLVLTVTAAETVLAGGPAALLGACGAGVARAAEADSLLETSGARGWRLGLALERMLERRAPVVGTSLVLNAPRLTAGFRGYPYDARALEQVASSRLRRPFAALPGVARRWLLQALPRELTASAAFAGPPSVAHAEALLRGVAMRAAPLERPVDALVVGISWRAPAYPHERPNPIVAAATGLGLALRLWRDAFPVVEGGTAILLHPLTRHFDPAARPYRALFATLRDGRAREQLATAELAAGQNDDAIAAYRAGRACHPLLPFADWASCEPALRRLGAVVIAGCRDHQAARALGFVPTHGPATALEMALGRAGGTARIGILCAPPYFPLEVGARAG